MSDRFLPIGKYVPPSANPPALQPSYSGDAQDTNPSDLSFQDVLSRQMNSSTRVRTIQAPPVVIPEPQHFARPTSRSTDLEAYSQTNEASYSTEQPVLMPKTQRVTDGTIIPIPQGADLEAIMLQNAADYQRMKKIPDLGSPALTSESQTPKPQAKMVPSYSAFNLNDLSTPDSPTPINTDVMNDPYPSSVLMQADVEPLDSISQSPKSDAKEKNRLGAIKRSARASKQPVASDPQSDEAAITGENGQTQETRDSCGVSHAVGSFFGNIASGVTLGFYRPAGEPEVHGVARMFQPIKKLAWDTPVSLVVGIPSGLAHSLSSKRETDEDTTRISSHYTGSTKPWLHRRPARMDAVQPTINQKPRWSDEEVPTQ